MPIEAIQTDKAPAAIGPYSQAVAAPAGRLVFVSGQIPIDPATGQVTPGYAPDQARRVMENLKAVLAAAGLDLSAVVKTTIYLTNLSDFVAVNEVYESFFEGIRPFPARACVEVCKLPKDVDVEIDCIAVAPAE